MTWLFHQSHFLLLLLAAGYGLAASALAWVIVVRALPHGTPEWVPVAPFAIAITSLFALFLAFLAGDIWVSNRNAANAARVEEHALERLSHALAVMGEDGVRGRALAAEYARTTFETEWRRLGNHQKDPAARRAVSELRRLFLTAAPNARDAVVAEGLDAIQALDMARAERLALGAAQGQSYRWAAVLILSLLSHIGVAIVHAGRPKAVAVSLVMFSVAASLALWILVLHDDPYGGAASVQVPEVPDFVGEGEGAAG